MIREFSCAVLVRVNHCISLPFSGITFFMYSILHVIVFTFFPLITHSKLSPFGFGFSRRIVNAVRFLSWRMVPPLSLLSVFVFTFFPLIAHSKLSPFGFGFSRRIVNATSFPLSPTLPHKNLNIRCVVASGRFTKAFLLQTCYLRFFLSFTWSRLFFLYPVRICTCVTLWIFVDVVWLNTCLCICLYGAMCRCSTSI